MRQTKTDKWARGYTTGPTGHKQKIDKQQMP